MSNSDPDGLASKISRPAPDIFRAESKSTNSNISQCVKGTNDINKLLKIFYLPTLRNIPSNMVKTTVIVG